MPRLTSGSTISEHRAHVESNLLDAFETVLADVGWDALTLRDVAVQAGVSRTVVYNYFRDRASMLIAWTGREMDQFLDLCERELAPAKGPVRRLELLVSLVLAEYACQRGPALEIHGVLSPADKAALMDHVEPLRDLVTHILRTGHDVGVMDCPDVDMAAQVVLAALESQRDALHQGGRLDDAAERLWPLVQRIIGVMS
ncbi:TetR family transcriptional regulator [Isoptericola jiangsuensis]|uniref:TetR family transcriptional regulator n=1 Tax=Isoptericola jiangsuensis TaxID=548579 RepID=A0A2A9ET85_9MICO|nr:TetR/AcrR family transcriptional regulator [Isoptericola jiangsuensis]PFG41379.1 TetR family transcriptional regulator [Isoptericola jiangsuensis]